MDFDDFLNELGASPSASTATTSAPTATESATNFSIMDDDEIDNIFSSISITSTTIPSSQSSNEAVIALPAKDNHDDLLSQDVPVASNSTPVNLPDDSDYHAGNVIDPSVNDNDIFANSSDTGAEAIHPSSTHIIDSTSTPAMMKEIDSLLLMPTLEATKPNVIDALIIASDVTKTPGVKKDLVGVSSSAILESMNFSPESDTPHKITIPPRSLMDVFNATYVDNSSNDHSNHVNMNTSHHHADNISSSSTPSTPNTTNHGSMMQSSVDNTPVINNKQSEHDFMAWLDDSDDANVASCTPYFVAAPIIDIAPRDSMAEINTILHSSFPDIPKLRQLLLDTRNIPDTDRCMIWNILLTGSNIEDLEAKYYHYKDEDQDTKNFSSLVKDVDVVILKYAKSLSQSTSPANDRDHTSSPSSMITSASFRSDLIDVISLYCLRKNLDYNPILLQLLLPLAYESRAIVPRTLLSSSFYNFIDNFVPLARLTEQTSEPTLSILHFWLRLLVGYHLPKLLQHLDRVLPGWELPCRSAISSSDIEQARIILHNSSHLDQLERDLGLDSIDDPFGWNVTAAPFANTPTGTTTTAWSTIKGSSSVDNLKPTSTTTGVLIDDSNPVSEDSSNHIRSGLIAHNWIAGNFTGSLPPALALTLYDWAILYDERYAGLFLIVSLLEIYHDSLLAMNGVQLTAWFHAIAYGHDEWFKLLPSAIVRKHFTSNDHHVVYQWKEFVSGWLHVTSALRQKTPSAFTKALNQTYDWSQTIQSHQHHARTFSQNSADLDKVPSSSNHNDTEYDASSSSQASKANSGANIMAQFKKLRMQFQLDPSPTDLGSTMMMNTSTSSSTAKIYPHDRYHESLALCLWSNPDEVVSCLTANRRRAVTSYDMMKYFDHGIDIFNQQTSSSPNHDIESIHIMLPKPDDSLIETPFYFGIDCRTKEEKELLGVFPRTYAFDPRLLSDADEVTKLLETLAPLASSVHLCIVGAGDDFYKWHESYQHTILQQQQQKKLWGIAALGKQNMNSSSNHALSSAQQNIVEERSKLNSLAMFFLKKSFRHVSILEGGFTAALRKIYHQQSISGLSNCLIDSNIHVINSLLGYDVNHVGTVIHAHPTASINESSSDTTSSSSVGSAPAQSSLANLQKVSGSIFNNISTATNNLLFTDSVPTPKAAATSAPFSAPADTISPTNATSSLLSSASAATHDDTPATASTTSAPAVNSNMSNAKDLFSGFTRKLSVFGSASLDTIKKSVAAAADGIQKANDPNPSSKASDDNMKRKEGFILVGKGTNKDKIDRQSAFVIDDEDEDDESTEDGSYTKSSSSESSSVELKDTHSVNVKRTDSERQHALILHKLAGLAKGDHIEITREFLPGAILFPCHKYKHFKAETTEGAAAAAGYNSSKLLDLPVNHDDELLAGDSRPEENVHEVHRYLVVTKERFMVLDADGGGIGSPAIVKSNHHLTELVKMTFRKKNPDLVTLFYHNGGENKNHKYRVPKKQEFVNTLQRNMQRFK